MKYIFFSICVLLIAASCSNSSHTTDSGFGYEFLHNSAGDNAQPGDWVFVHTRVTVGTDSVIYDSDSEQPGGVAVQLPGPDENNVRSELAPVQDVLRHASVGDSIRLYYPVDSFDNPPPSVAAYDMVNYDMKVRSIKSQTEYEQQLQAERQQAAQQSQAAEAEVGNLLQGLQAIHSEYVAGQLESQITRTQSGLGYIIRQPGEEGTRPSPGTLIKAHYFGLFVENGEMFDNSISRGATYDFQLGQGAVIPAWDEAFAMLNKGAEAILFVPPQLAYGESGYGSIPPNAELMFYIYYVE